MRSGIAVLDRPAVKFSSVLCAVMCVALAIVSAAAGAETYVQATIDKSGQLHIVTKDQREIVPKKKKGQVGFDQPQISPDGRKVGWSELYPNCCTSYPIPLGLVIYTSGRKRAFEGNGLLVSRWCFEDQGKQVAFRQETVHGGMGVHYELRDVATGRLVAKYDPPVGSDNISRDTALDAPKWVAELDAKK